MKLRILSRGDVAAAIDMPQAIEAMREAFGALSAGTVMAPLRLPVSTAEGITVFMPAYLTGRGALGAKIASVYRNNAARGLPAVSALVLILDNETGVPLALMEGGYLTALRTGATSGLATQLLALPTASVFAMFGAGGQARAQLAAVRAVRPIREVRIVDRSPELARALAAEITACTVTVTDDPREAVSGAHIVTTVTTSETPVFDGRDLAPGTHVNGVGSFTPQMQEVDTHVVAKAKIVVDARSGALAEAGDLTIPISGGIIRPEDIHAELGEIINGTAPGRSSPDEITFFKTVGNAAQDVTAARHVFELAERRNLGTLVDL